MEVSASEPRAEEEEEDVEEAEPEINVHQTSGGRVLITQDGVSLLFMSETLP